jgi:hypothetical protein
MSEGYAAPQQQDGQAPQIVYVEALPQPQVVYVQNTATAVVQGRGRWAWRHGALYHLFMTVITCGVWLVVAPVLYVFRGLVKG